MKRKPKTSLFDVVMAPRPISHFWRVVYRTLQCSKIWFYSFVRCCWVLLSLVLYTFVWCCTVVTCSVMVYYIECSVMQSVFVWVQCCSAGCWLSWHDMTVSCAQVFCTQSWWHCEHCVAGQHIAHSSECWQHISHSSEYWQHIAHISECWQHIAHRGHIAHSRELESDTWMTFVYQ